MCKQPSSESNPKEKVKATLYLEDGTKFEGYSFGSNQGIGGEVGKPLCSSVILLSCNLEMLFCQRPTSNVFTKYARILVFIGNNREIKRAETKKSL